MFSLEGPLWRALNFIADMVILHVLWLVFSLPLFTIGASTTALYYAAMKRMRTDEGHVASNFFRSFKENFRQATIYWLILAGVGVVLWLDLNFASTLGGTMGRAMLISCSVFLIPYGMTLLYLFPILAKFTGSLFDNFKNALLLALRHFPSTILLAIIWGTVWLLLAIFPPFSGLMLCCGAGLMAFVTAPIYIQIFRVYLPKEMEEDLKRSGDVFRR